MNHPVGMMNIGTMKEDKMKKVLAFVMGTSLLVGCSPSRSEMQASIDDLTEQLADSEDALEAKEEERALQVELLCGLVGEAMNFGMVQYVGSDTFALPDGSLQTMEGMSDKCLEMVEDYEKEVRQRAARLGLEATSSEETTE